MEEIEVPIEKIQEEIHEHAIHGHNEQQPWNSKVALFSAIVAVFAAIAALLAGHNSNEAMIEQIRASDHWNHYQAKGIKSAILSSKLELLTELGKEAAPSVEQKIEGYKKEQEELSEKAKEREEKSERHLRVHQEFARSVTFFQIAITIAAISVLTRRKRFFFVGLGFSAIGLWSFVEGFLIK